MESELCAGLEQQAWKKGLLVLATAWLHDGDPDVPGTSLEMSLAQQIILVGAHPIGGSSL